MSRSRRAFALAAFLGMISAGMSAHAADTSASGNSVALFSPDSKQVADAPSIKRVIGRVSGSACNEPYDSAKAQADALKKLQARALQQGGDGVTEVQFTQVTNTRSPCWHGVEATGVAVIYQR